MPWVAFGPPSWLPSGSGPGQAGQPPLPHSLPDPLLEVLAGAGCTPSPPADGALGSSMGTHVRLG